MTARPRISAGFTLLELLLVVGLLAMILSGLYQIFDNWTQRAVNRTAASDMMRVQNAAQDYVKTNFEAMRNDTPVIFTEIPISSLQGGNFLPNGFLARNAFRQEIRVFKRNVRIPRKNPDGTDMLDTAGNIRYTTNIEVVTVSDDPPGGTLRIPNKRLIDAAQAGGPRMGVVSEVVLPGATFAGRVSGIFSDWYYDLGQLASAGYDADPDSAGGYLAAFGIVNTEETDVNPEWLYRVAVDDYPELNRMGTDLIMNGHRLENVGTIVADRMSVTGNAAFRGITQGTTSETAQSMTVEQALRVDGAGESRINMKVTNGACTMDDPNAPPGSNRTLSGAGCSISGGEVQVIAENRVNPITGAVTGIAGNATMAIANALRSDGSVITDISNINGTTTSDGINTFETVGGSQLTATTTVVAPITAITGGTIQTQQLQTGNMNLRPGGYGYINNQLVTARVSPNGTRGFTTPNMNVANAAEFSGTMYAQGANATNTLYIEDVYSGYRDSWLPQDIACTQQNGRTYCEPYGRTNWYTANGHYITDCSIHSDGYSCLHTRVGYGAYGTCDHRRRTGATGQAYHTTNCVTF